MIRSHSRSLILLAGIVAVLNLLVFDVSAQPELQETGSFEPTDCWFEKPIPILPGPEFECGYVTVPERHEAPDGPTIRLPVARVRAQGENPQPDPLFLAQGGPGGDAFEVFSVMLGTGTFWHDRDVVIFNQRGTRYAAPDLSCTESFDAAAELLTMQPDEAETRALELVQQCYDRLTAEGVDLSAFNSLQNAADVEAIRQGLGYESYNFYGVSYGTLLGLHLLRNQDGHLRSAILDGVVPTNLNFIPKVIPNTDRVFSEIIKTCEEDAACREEYPELEERFFRLVEELNASPRTVQIKDQETGQTVAAYLDGDTLVDVLFQAFYLPDSYAYFPKLVANLEAGDMTFIEGIWPLFAFDRSISEGMYYSVICAEDADFVPAELTVTGVRPYFAARFDDDLQSYRDACAIWKVDQLSATVDDPVTSDVPVLLLSGHYDPITPPYFADVASESLRNDSNLVDPTGSHGVAFGDPCIDKVMQQFLDDPGSSLDSTCISEIEYKEFAPSNAISFPFIGEINQLSEAVWWQLGLATIFLLIVLSAFLVLPLSWIIRAFSKKPAPIQEPPERRLRQVAGILVLLFGLMALVFVAGAAFYTFRGKCCSGPVLRNPPGAGSPGDVNGDCRDCCLAFPLLGDLGARLFQRAHGGGDWLCCCSRRGRHVDSAILR
jgi:pimeloyl-ACP methyl ester carboxylesterase